MHRDIHKNHEIVFCNGKRLKRRFGRIHSDYPLDASLLNEFRENLERVLLIQAIDANKTSMSTKA